MHQTALIMAGGRGERFWPASRQSLPKQFLSLTPDGKTMIQLTVERIMPLVALENIYIATNAAYKALVLSQLPGLPEENILCEPVGRNTAPCIGLAAIHIAKRYDDAMMYVLPSDHIIKMNDVFVTALKNASEIAQADRNLVTLGITPTYPETGYGYIRFDTEAPFKDGYRVKQFVEKPDIETAKQYLATGEYQWNSGMFIWKVSSILYNLKALMPETYDGLMRIGESIGTKSYDQTLEREFTALPSESIDFGIMEKADGIYTIAGMFGWDDVGSWLAMERLSGCDADGNAIRGNVLAIEGTKNCILHGTQRVIAAVGIEGLVIVDTPDALLVCDKAKTGDIRKVLQGLRDKELTEYI